MDCRPPDSIPPSADATLIVGQNASAMAPLFPGPVRITDARKPSSLSGLKYVVLTDPGWSHHDAMTWLSHADQSGVTVWMPAALLPVLQTAGVLPRRIGGQPFFRFAGLPRRQRRWPVETLSPLLALAVMPVLLPVLAVVALRVWTTDGRPIVFAQRRIGHGGKRFTIYKFRTMFAARASAKQVTEAGERLRRHGLDELPQFFNLLTGSMALIGPRPLPVDEHPKNNGVGAWMATRERVRPGLTGLYQVCPHRRDIGLVDMCILDAYWMHNRSLRLNAWIMMRTVVAMFQGWGRGK